MKCHCANELRIEKRSSYQDRADNLDNLYFDNVTFELCDNCGEEIISYYKINQLYRTIAQAIVLQPWLLRGQDITFLRKERAIKPKDWADMLAFDIAILSDLESNKHPLNPQTDMAIRLLYCRLFEEQENSLFPQPITNKLLNRNINHLPLAICIDMENPVNFAYRNFNELKLAS